MNDDPVKTRENSQSDRDYTEDFVIDQITLRVPFCMGQQNLYVDPHIAAHTGNLGYLLGQRGKLLIVLEKLAYSAREVHTERV